MLTGCAAPAHDSAPVPHAVVAKAVPVPDGIVGTGTLTSWNGKTTGALQVVAKSGSFTLVLSQFSTDFTGQNLFVLADAPVTMSQCGENNLWQIGLTTQQNNAIAPTMSFSLPNEGGAWSDPTFFRAFAFVQYPATDSAGQVIVTRGCQQPIVALTTIHWNMETIYPTLTVRDHGQAAGARGTVTKKSGALFTYKTARGDTWAAIAHRFELTPAELRYLNPIRHPDAVVAEAYADQVVNLDPDNRGNSESRRPGAQ